MCAMHSKWNARAPTHWHTHAYVTSFNYWHFIRAHCNSIHQCLPEKRSPAAEQQRPLLLCACHCWPEYVQVPTMRFSIQPTVTADGGGRGGDGGVRMFFFYFYLLFALPPQSIHFALCVLLHNRICSYGASMPRGHRRQSRRGVHWL